MNPDEVHGVSHTRKPTLHGRRPVMAQTSAAVTYDPLVDKCRALAVNRIEVYGPAGSPFNTDLVRSVYGCEEHTPLIMDAVRADGDYPADIPMLESLSRPRCGFTFHYGHPTVSERMAGIAVAHACLTSGHVVDMDQAAEAVAKALGRRVA